MKKITFLVTLLLGICSLANAGWIIGGDGSTKMIFGGGPAIASLDQVVYRGTLTGLRISSVDGTAFIDNAGTTVTTYADGNHQISIFDSSGMELRGVLKAAGTSEELGSELLTGWTNHPTQGFDTFTTSGREISSAIELTSGGRAYSEITFDIGKLYKVDLTGYTLNSGTAPRIAASDVNSTDSPGIRDLISESPIDFYFTKRFATHIGVRAVWEATNFAITDTSVKQVTAPSSSGATIVSTKGGTTRNFSQKNSSFTYNAASYYVIVRKMP
jgi:hypothetical protein